MMALATSITRKSQYVMWDWSRVTGLTFVLWLGRSGIACDEILVIVWSNGIKVHGPRDIQQDHSVVCRDFRRIKGSERGGHDLLRVALRGMLKMAGIIGRVVCRRWCN